MDCFTVDLWLFRVNSMLVWIRVGLGLFWLGLGLSWGFWLLARNSENESMVQCFGTIVAACNKTQAIIVNMLTLNMFSLWQFSAPTAQQANVEYRRYPTNASWL